MLDNLVESKNNSRAVRKLYGFLFSTFLVICTMLVTATLWSLFAKDFAMGSDGMELSALITPLPVEDDQPKPEPEKPKQQNQPQTAKQQTAIRNMNTARIDEVQPTPDKVSVTPNTNKARPKGTFEVNPNAVERESSAPNSTGRENSKNSEIGFTKPENQSTAVEITKSKNITAPPALKENGRRQKNSDQHFARRNQRQSVQFAGTAVSASGASRRCERRG